MGRKSVSKSKSGHQGTIKEGSLTIFARGNWLHIRGTVRVRGETFRPRRCLGLASDKEENWEKAREIARKTINEFQEKVIHGVQQSASFSYVAARYIKSWVNYKPADAANIEELLQGYPLPKTRKRQRAEPLHAVHLSNLTKRRIADWYDKRFPTQGAATIRRHQNTLAAILNYARDELDETVHGFTKKRIEKKSGRSLGKRFLPGEVERMIELAPEHARPLIATLYVTGARTEMAIHLKKTENFILVPGRGKIFFPDSKNGNAYIQPLHDFAVTHLLEWIEGRKDGHEEMFLTSNRKPYSVRQGYGGHIKTMFATAREALAKEIEADGDPERAAIIRTFTPKWFRHNFANALRAGKSDLKDIMEAGMWKSPQVIMEHYMGEAPDRVSEQVRNLPFGTKLTQRKKVIRK
ncbi:MAG: tyrosine-type recombinase/integrase [Sneathiella sp.]